MHDAYIGNLQCILGYPPLQPPVNGRTENISYVFYFAGHRLHDFNVGLLSGTRPGGGSSLSVTSYSLCAHYSGSLPSNATIQLYCTFPLELARTVVIQIPGM